MVRQNILTNGSMKSLFHCSFPQTDWTLVHLDSHIQMVVNENWLNVTFRLIGIMNAAVRRGAALLLNVESTAEVVLKSSRICKI